MTRSRTAARGGFSRIELAVVMLLGVCLLGLLTPALYGARQGAARQNTMNNLKQTGLALHNCNDAYGRLPPAYGKAFNFKKNASIHIYLLPFLEQNNLFQQYLQQGGGGDLDKAVIPTYLAPLDKTNPDPAKGIQNFAANLRVFGDTKTKYDAAVPLADTMDSEARIPQTFTDGTSNTVVFATKYGVCGKGGSHYASPPKSDTAAFFGQNPAKVKASPSDPKATFQDRPSKKQCLCVPLMAQSYEEEGLLVGMADGSARRVSPRVSPETWNAALHPSDGMVLGADW